MDHEFNRKWLEDKFENIRSRILKALVQLNDEQVNWRPNHSSLSISTLIRHIEGNIQERVMKGILQQDVAPRNREQELTQVFVSRDDLIQIVKNRFQFLIDTVKSMSSQDFEQVQSFREKNGAISTSCISAPRIIRSIWVKFLHRQAVFDDSI